MQQPVADEERTVIARMGDEVFTPDGAFLAEWGSFGEETGQLVETTSLAIDAAGDIYVTDYTLGTLQKFHPEPPRSPGVSAPAP